MRRKPPLHFTVTRRPMSPEQEKALTPILECLIAEMVEQALDSLLPDNPQPMDGSELTRTTSDSSDLRKRMLYGQRNDVARRRAVGLENPMEDFHE